MKKNSPGSTQYAALPFRIGSDGLPEILLLTSRETHRWVIPKGWPMKGMKPREVAAREAFEEAGLVGEIVGKKPVGIFHYQKQIGEASRLCEVRVYLLRVDRQADDWPEKPQRETRWFNPQEAASKVDEGGLSELMKVRFAGVQPRAPLSRFGAETSQTAH